MCSGAGEARRARRTRANWSGVPAPLPLTVGPVVCAVGMVTMLRVGAGASYLTDVLAALLVIGAGMVTMVAR
ncbi:hypothetical protein [Streptomyces sp. NPDC052727]|uniref:hypothetical protein n=1 Tax=unclassified Streptomyces TaxID=2593676 RepID=UPI00344268BC